MTHSFPTRRSSNLIAGRAAILARVGAGDQATVGMVDPHRLAAAERTPHRLEHMAASLQCREGLGREGVLHLQLAGGGEAARRVHRLLPVPAEAGAVAEEV